MPHGIGTVVRLQVVAAGAVSSKLRGTRGGREPEAQHASQPSDYGAESEMQQTLAAQQWSDALYIMLSSWIFTVWIEDSFLIDNEKPDRISEEKRGFSAGSVARPQLIFSSRSLQTTEA